MDAFYKFLSNYFTIANTIGLVGSVIAGILLIVFIKNRLYYIKGITEAIKDDVHAGVVRALSEVVDLQDLVKGLEGDEKKAAFINKYMDDKHKRFVAYMKLATLGIFLLTVLILCLIFYHPVETTKPVSNSASVNADTVIHDRSKPGKKTNVSPHPQERRGQEKRQPIEPLATTVVLDSFYRDGVRPYQIYYGIRVNYTRVSGNHTDLNFPIKSYFISDALPFELLKLYAAKKGLNRNLPPRNSDGLIHGLLFAEAWDIADMLKADIPTDFQIVNADMGEFIHMGTDSLYCIDYGDAKKRNIVLCEVHKRTSFIGDGNLGYTQKYTHFFLEESIYDKTPKYDFTIRLVKKEEK